jgi:CIC family chloride channel protein
VGTSSQDETNHSEQQFSGAPWTDRLSSFLSLAHFRRGVVSSESLTIVLAGFVGVSAGLGAALFTWLIHAITSNTLGEVMGWVDRGGWQLLGLIVIPAAGLLFVSWFTRTLAPEAQGHGVPEVIVAVARHDGVIRPHVALVKILASGICIGTGGSVGREGPIVQIGSALGSTAGQLFKLSSRNIKVLVAAGAAAGISATFNAPIAGVMFASEIILGSFAVESLTPIVIASVLADVVQQHIGEHRFKPAFIDLNYDFQGAWNQLPSYLVLGVLAGLAAAGFTKLLYKTEDLSERWLTSWWQRALVLGALVGLSGALYPMSPPAESKVAHQLQQESQLLPPLMGVGYSVVAHATHLNIDRRAGDGSEHAEGPSTEPPTPAGILRMATNKLSHLLDKISAEPNSNREVTIPWSELWNEFWWLLPLALLKPLMTSLALAGGGSGGVFAPSLYLGATLGACVGLVANAFFPEYSNAPGVYAIVGMGAVVAGTTQGVLSAILIVYEMTNNYQVILPIMATAGIASMLSRWVEPESIYLKKLSRRGESIARGHDMHRLDHVMVADVMICRFPMLKHTDTISEIVRIARENPHIESLPVMGVDERLIGIIRAEDIHRVLDTDIVPALVNAEDIAMKSPISVHPRANLIEALRDFGTRDVETLPVEVGQGANRRLIGLLLRSDVMSRYRQEMLQKH